MIPPELVEQITSLEPIQFLAVVVGIWLVGKTLWRFGAWIVKRFFPGLVAGARAVLNGAQILAAVKDSPDFQERMDKAVESLVGKVDEIHHEVHFNNGSSVKDAVVRVEESVKGLHGRMDPVERDLKLAVESVSALQKADAEIRAEIKITHPKEQDQ